MRKYLKDLIFLTIVVLSLGILPKVAMASDPGQPDPCGDPDSDCPIDGGITILIAAGVAVGIKKIREERKKKLNELH